MLTILFCSKVDASAIRGSRRKRKRRLVVDNVKAFSADYMKNQMIDPSDLVLPLDLAPPTKRLILMKETGTSDKLFILPGRQFDFEKVSSPVTAGLLSFFL